MKQTPLPIVSGRYFFPNAPLLCLKWIPACAVTSMNWIGPEGRGASGVGETAVALAGTDAVAPVGAAAGDSGFALAAGDFPLEVSFSTTSGCEGAAAFSDSGLDEHPQMSAAVKTKGQNPRATFRLVFMPSREPSTRSSSTQTNTRRAAPPAPPERAHRMERIPLDPTAKSSQPAQRSRPRCTATSATSRSSSGP